MNDMTGKLTIVGFGPGSKEDMTLRAVKAIEDADIVTGYTTYVDILSEFFPKKRYNATGMMKEVERCRMAVRDAMEGLNVAMVSSGDSGIYGMAGIVYQVADELGADIEIEAVPGVTAASKAASLLGAPLMHDTALISLSDLLTPLEMIMERVKAASSSDMVICLYNPKSKGRSDYLERAAEIIISDRGPDVPVGVVRNAGRRGESVEITTLKDIGDVEVDMLSIVIVGNSETYVSKGRMVTPRGYKL